MTLPHRRRAFQTRILSSLILAVLAVCLPGGAIPGCPAAVIVLDPGHGGRDSGAGPKSEYPEKRFTLALAEKIARFVDKRHHLALTRTADIAVEPDDRAAVANQLQADLFISLHSAPPPYCGDQKAFIYYHDGEHLVLPAEITRGSAASESADAPVEWSQRQNRHSAESRKLAEAIRQTIQIEGIFNDVVVAGAPLVALMGADSPALLIEVGCIFAEGAPPLETMETQLDRYAQAIAKAIEQALSALKP